MQVLLSEPVPHENHFIDNLASCMPEEVSVLGFTWSRALFGNYDVFHIQWPESIYSTKKTRLNALKHALGGLLWARLRILRTPVVWTVHNALPHDRIRGLDGRLYRAFTSLVTMRVGLTSDPELEPDVVIPHGDYRRSYEESQTVKSSPPEILYFGLVRPYKGIETLIESWKLMNSLCTLTIRGRPADESYAELVRNCASECGGIFLDLSRVPDEEVSNCFARASLVVLPYARFSNSGVLMLALSLRRPVLVPCTPATLSVREAVGRRWVHLYRGPLAPSDLDAALEDALTLSAEEEPDLSRFDWDVIGRAYAQVYRRARVAKRRRL